MLSQALHFPWLQSGGTAWLNGNLLLVPGWQSSPCFTHGLLPFPFVISSNWCVALARFYGSLCFGGCDHTQWRQICIIHSQMQCRLDFYFFLLMDIQVVAKKKNPCIQFLHNQVGFFVQIAFLETECRINQDVSEKLRQQQVAVLSSFKIHIAA